MAVYIPKYNGYIADVANLWFDRADGKHFYFNKATATNVSPSQDSTPINGGWGTAPLAYINGQQTLDLAFTSAEFTMDMFEAANAVQGEEKADDYVDDVM